MSLIRFQFFYTILVVCLNVISAGGGSNLYLPSDYPNGFTPEETEERILGSKIVIVSEQVCWNTLEIYLFFFPRWSG